MKCKIWFCASDSQSPQHQETMRAFIGDLPDNLFNGKTILLRVDLNVPLGFCGEDGIATVTDSSRLSAILPTVQYLRDCGARAICLCSHLGRPSGGYTKELSLIAVKQPLSLLLGESPITFVSDCVGPVVSRALKSSKSQGEIFLLENTRFHLEEELNDNLFSKEMAEPFDLYVNDAFGTAHRAHASTEGVTHFIGPCIGGLLMKKEMMTLSAVTKNPGRPMAAIIGGAKISTKIDVIFNLLRVVDKLIIGGAMVFTFYRSIGLEVGNSRSETKYIPVADKIILEAGKRGVSLLLASDVIIADSLDSPTYIRTVKFDDIPEGSIGLDIGDQSIRDIRCELEGCKTVIWNGPVGAFERPQFGGGTRQLAHVVADMTSRGATTVVCGGDTVAAVSALPGLEFSLVSTGGGATLEFLEGQSLPGIEALSNLADLWLSLSSKEETNPKGETAASNFTMAHALPDRAVKDQVGFVPTDVRPLSSAMPVNIEALQQSHGSANKEKKL